ncbi:hypothetical protein BFF78_37850 [Streptomyces fodineus]|uniref:Lipoprotein n=1 Tax=Streptomyces fodineus TaxID=1904616 RepID=A0A1D7YKI5_9ACTN|nr:hypothetical protein [Streptomyces fodineus]AOR36054.1 hypothetical protein BFF78_37850 [Streptomyces fodineus]
MSVNFRQKSTGWIAGVVLAAAVTTLSGCTDNKGAATDKPSAHGSAAAHPGARETGSAGTKPQRPGAGDQSTPEAAVATLITAIIDGDTKQACLVSGTPATGSAPAKVGTKSMCESDSPEVRQMGDMVKRLRVSFTPKKPSGDPKVTVSQVSENGGKAVVPADKITVDGQTLDAIILSHSTGLKPGQVNVKFDATKIAGPWYVTNMDLAIG